MLASIGERCDKNLANLDQVSWSLAGNSEIERAKPRVFIFFYLFSLLEGNRDIGTQLSQFNNLLNSCISRHFACTICFFCIQELLSKPESKNYVNVARRLKCDEMLSPAARSSFDAAVKHFD